jgi:hypothetical protein
MTQTATLNDSFLHGGLKYIKLYNICCKGPKHYYPGLMFFQILDLSPSYKLKVFRRNEVIFSQFHPSLIFWETLATPPAYCDTELISKII